MEADLMTKAVGECEYSPEDGTISDRDKNAKRNSIRRKIIRTIFDGFASLFLGMQIGQKGPSFLDLQHISGTDVEKTSSYLTVFCFGYMLGALLAGFLYDKLGNKMALKYISLTLASLFTGITPVCTSYVTMLIAHLMSATMCGIVETAVTADQFQLWVGKSDSALQFISLMYSLGAVFGPLYTEPFLVPKLNETHHLSDERNTTQRNNITGFTYSLANLSLSSIPSNQSVYNTDLERNQTNSVSTFDTQPASELFYAYMITGLLGILFSLPYFVLCLRNCSKSKQREKKSENPAEVEPKRLSLKVYVILTMIACFFIGSEEMIEDVINMYLAMFVVSHLSWTKENGALISSLYWGIKTICNLIAVPLVTKIDMGVLLLISTTGMVFSMIAFALASQYHIHIMVWLSISFYAACESSIDGGGFSWVDTNILKLDGKATSASVISASIGAMIGPIVLGVTMENISLMFFPFTSLLICVVTMFYFFFMIFFLKPYVTRKYGPVRVKESKCIGSDTELKEKKTMLPENGKEDDFSIGERNGKI